MNEDDRQLAARLLAGDEGAYREFFDDYFGRLYRFAARRCGGDLDQARDIAQATLIKGVRALGSYRGEASLFTWFCQIARRELFDVLQRPGAVRKQSIRFDDAPEVRAALESMEGAAGWSPESSLQAEQSADVVHVVLDSLPTKYATLLEMKYIEELSVDVIAERVGATPTAVQSMLARARAAFEESFNSVTDGMDAIGAIGPGAR